MTVPSVLTAVPAGGPPSPTPPRSGVDRALRERIAARLRPHRAALVSRWYEHQFDPALAARYAIAGLNGADPGELRQRYVGPLFDLLLAALPEDDGPLADVYLDERRRYAPHLQAPEVLQAYFAEVLPRDADALLDRLQGEEREGMLRWLEALHQPLLAPVAGSPLRVLALGDCLLGEVRVFLLGHARRSGWAVDLRQLYFSAPQGRALGTDEATGMLARFPADLVAMSFLSYEGIPPYAALLRDADRLGRGEVGPRVAGILGMVRGYVEALRAKTDVPFLLHNASGLPLTGWRRRLGFLPPLSTGRRRVLAELNEGLAALAAGLPNVILIDEAGVVARHGAREASRPVVSASVVPDSFFHAARLGQFLVEPYADVLDSYRALARTKVLCVDFDNTLWEGVMAEGPVRQLPERQQLLRRLKEAGILLVAVSKNDPASIRWSELALTPDDFVLHKINWDLKAQSIRAAAEQLDLGLDSFVLLDDNPVERELVEAQLPKVRALDSLEPRTWRWLERMQAFPNTRETAEARQRTELYRQQALRKEALAGEVDYPAMMASLGLVAEFGPVTPRDLDRVTELVQRTNQFNTTTIRYGRQALQDMLQSPSHAVYAANLADKFGTVGLVGVVIVERQAARVILDSFIMSCRAMGFELERLMLALVREAEGPAREVVGRFVPTDRNGPASGLYAGQGFEPAGPTEWRLPAGAPGPERPAWFTVRPRGS